MRGKNDFISPNTIQQKEPNMTRNVIRAIEHVERVLEHVLDRSKLPKNETAKTKPPTIRGWRAPASDHSQYPEPKARTVFREKSNVSKLAVTARAVKVSIPLDPTAIGANGERVELVVNCDGQQYAQWCGKSVCNVARQIEGQRDYRMWSCRADEGDDGNARRCQVTGERTVRVEVGK